MPSVNPTRSQFSRTRNGIFAALDISNPDRPAVAALGEKQRESLFDRIAQWREFIPSENRTRLIMDFNRPTLLRSKLPSENVSRFSAEEVRDKSTLLIGERSAEQIGQFSSAEIRMLLGESRQFGAK